MSRVEQAAQRLLSEVELQQEGLPSHYTDAFSADIVTVVEALKWEMQGRDNLNAEVERLEKENQRLQAIIDGAYM